MNYLDSGRVEFSLGEYENLPGCRYGQPDDLSACRESTMEVLSLTSEDISVAMKKSIVQYPPMSPRSIATYQGLLNEFPYKIIINMYSVESFASRQRLRSELRAMKLCRHKNIIRYLGGRSMEGGRVFTGIFENFSNRTLQGRLYADPNGRITWVERLQIALDVAKGLSYLHEELDDRIHLAHCNLSSSAIYFSGQRAKIGRFELSRLVKDNRGVSAKHIPLCKPGYMPPEATTTRDFEFTKIGDVYSFGVIILELIMRRHPHKPGWLSERVRASLGSGQDLSEIVDPTLLPELDTIRESVFAVLVNVGLQCTEINPMNRPTMAEVVLRLESIIGSRVEPVEMPSFFRDLDTVDLEITLLFDSLEYYHQQKYRHGIVRKQWKKLSRLLRGGGERVPRPDPEPDYSLTDLDVVEIEQEYLASEIIEKRRSV